jgi:uncharacterized protein (TIGR02391 family)
MEVKCFVASRRSPDIPPTLTPHRAVALLRTQIDDIDRVAALRSDDPEGQKWSDTTGGILHGAFGKPNGEPAEMTRKFITAGPSLTVRPRGFSGRGGTPDWVFQDHHRKCILAKKAVLESCIQQLEILAPPAATVAAGQYQFHAEIERVSGALFRDGHFKPAAFEAYIRVIEEVKRRSGLPLDGDPLMNQAFGCDNRTPVLKFNSLSTDAERDEQKGFMFLFKGIVGLRNSKAHSNRLFDDPARAHDYLALASLLMRVLELAS